MTLIEFIRAKNGELTAKADGLFLHSSYNPSKESERFAQNLKVERHEEAVIIIEPGISYVAGNLRKIYPAKKIGAIRLEKSFREYDGLFDFVLDFCDDTRDDSELQNLLLGKLGEQMIFSAHFADWEPSKKAFAQGCARTHAAIKGAMEKARTILVTREYFEKKWLLNSAAFVKYLRNPVSLREKIGMNVLIVASGPSLHNALGTIREFQADFFTIVLSSALSACKKNGISADLVMSTDGGFWAGEHLKHLDYSTVLALSPESFCARNRLERNPVLPLFYRDGLSKKLTSLCGFSGGVMAERNGTVSGTALEFALKNSSGKIYFSGLDMATARGFQHENPNEIEKNNEQKDDRLRPRSTRCLKSELSGESLGIYLQWFRNTDFEPGRIFRVIDSPQNSLGRIQDITTADFKTLCEKNHGQAIAGKKEPLQKDFFVRMEDAPQNPQRIKPHLDDIFDDDAVSQIFPLTSLSLRRNPGNNELKERLAAEVSHLRAKIKDILDD